MTAANNGKSHGVNMGSSDISIPPEPQEGDEISAAVPARTIAALRQAVPVAGRGTSIDRTANGSVIHMRGAAGNPPTFQSGDDSDSSGGATPDAGIVPRAGETKTISESPEGKLYLFSGDTLIPTGTLKTGDALKANSFVAFLEDKELKWARASELAAPPPAWRWGKVATQGQPGDLSYGIYQWKEDLVHPVTNPPTYQERGTPDHLVLALVYHSGQHS